MQISENAQVIIFENVQFLNKLEDLKINILDTELMEIWIVNCVISEN